MGVSLEYWGGNIGLFYGKIISNVITSRCAHYDNFSILKKVFAIWLKFIGILPIQLFFRLVMLFSYCTMVVLLSSFIIMVYLFCFVFCSAISSSRYPSPFAIPSFAIPSFAIPSFAHAYLFINATLKVISHSIKVSISYDVVYKYEKCYILSNNITNSSFSFGNY